MLVNWGIFNNGTTIVRLYTSAAAPPGVDAPATDAFLAAAAPRRPRRRPTIDDDDDGPRPLHNNNNTLVYIDYYLFVVPC